MKNNKLTLAAAAAAAIMAAPIFTPAISSFAANATTASEQTTAEQIINQVGEIRGSADIYDKNGNKTTSTPLSMGSKVNLSTQLLINGKYFYMTDKNEYLLATDVRRTGVPVANNENTEKDTETSATGTIVITTSNAALYDKTGDATGQVFQLDKNLPFTAIATINGKEYYKVSGGYILKTDATAVAAPTEKTPLKGTVKIAAGYTAVFNGEGKATTKLLKKGTSWKVFYKTIIGGKYFYNLGGDQYILASSAAFLPANQPVPMKAVGTVHYVPGYGIQIWTENLGFVKDAYGANKKLPHGTSWKVFARMNIQGKVYYNLGGNQWIDANYMSLR